MTRVIITLTTVSLLVVAAMPVVYAAMALA